MIHMTTIGYDAIMSLKIRNGVTLHDVYPYMTLAEETEIVHSQIVEKME